LELTGFVTIRQGVNGGAYVTDLSLDHVGNAFFDLFLTNKLSISELIMVRKYIEPEVARLAALNITSDAIKKLLIAQKEEMKPATTFSNKAEKLQNIHCVLAEICGNKFFEAISKSITRLIRQIVDTVEPEKDMFHVQGEHQPIFKAVLDGDSDKAAREMSKHLEKVCNSLLEMECEYRKKQTLV
jgi:DNA-binding FadR family transcriptional regulator